MDEQKKLVTVDDELYYPAEEFERNIELARVYAAAVQRL